MCWWEDDGFGFYNPDDDENANWASLRVWQKDFYKVDENKKLIFENLQRQEHNFYDFDANWKPLDE